MWVTLPAPLIMPENPALVLLAPPIVSVVVASEPSVTLPLPFSAPTPLLLSARSSAAPLATVQLPVPNDSAEPARSVPASTTPPAANPLLMPARISVPAPFLVSVCPASAPTTVPLIVSSVPDVATSMAPPPVPRVNPRSISIVPPVYSSSPPPWSTRLDESDEAAPIPLARLPLASVPTDRVPSRMVVTPT